MNNINPVDNIEYGTWDTFGEYQHYLNTNNYDFKCTNTKCSQILLGLFARISLRFNENNQDIKVHVDILNNFDSYDNCDSNFNMVIRYNSHQIHRLKY